MSVDFPMPSVSNTAYADGAHLLWPITSNPQISHHLNMAYDKTDS